MRLWLFFHFWGPNVVAHRLKACRNFAVRKLYRKIKLQHHKNVPANLLEPFVWILSLHCVISFCSVACCCRWTCGSVCELLTDRLSHCCMQDPSSIYFVRVTLYWKILHKNFKGSHRGTNQSAPKDFCLSVMPMFQQTWYKKKNC